MWLRLSAVVISMVFTAVATGCVDRGAAAVDYRHHRDDNARVHAPAVRAEVEGEAVAFRGRVGADVVSGATPVMAAPDVYTRASNYDEARGETSVGADWRAGRRTTLSGGVAVSREGDYAGDAASASVVTESDDRQTTASVDVGAGGDRIGHSGDSRFEEVMWTAQSRFGISRVLNAQMVGHLYVDAEGRFGYQASPYRGVPVYEEGIVSPPLVISERHPHRRLRLAVEPRVVWSPARTVFLHGGYRLYGDDWGVWSHTADTELWKTWFDDVLRTGVRFRGYTQNEADFYRARYRRVERFRTGDFRLSSMSSVGAEGSVELRWTTVGDRRLVVSGGYGVTLYQYANYAPRDSMLGRSLSLTVRGEWQ